VNTWKVILATLVIFVAGLVTGGVLVVYSGRSLITRPPRTNSQRASLATAGGMRLEFLRRMQRDLDLTADQREHVDKILKESQERSRKIMEPVSPSLREEFQRTKEEFREILTADQRARFDDLFKHQQRPHEQRRSTLQNEHPSETLAPTNSP
jgi:hypothetical protein